MTENNTIDRGEIGVGCTTDRGVDRPQIHPQLRGRHLGPAKGLSKGRLARLRLRTVHDLDRRTRSYRTAMAVVGELTEALGGNLTPSQRVAVEQVAMLETIAADLVARHIARLSVNLDEALRAGNAARRARRAVLAMKPEPVEQERPGLAIAKARWAEMDRQKAAAQQAKERKDHP